MTWMLRNSAGRPDAVLTMTVAGVLVVLFKLVLSGASIALAGKTFTLGTIDAGTIASVLTPLLSAYCVRRHGEKAPVPPPSVNEGTK